METREGIQMRDFAVEHAQRALKAPIKGQESQPEIALPGSFWARYIRITIDEDESRDHLALERTFLAYLRTASAIAQFGVLVAQLFRLNTNQNKQTTTTLRIGTALGATTEGVAIVVSLIGAAYFAKQQIGLIKGAVLSRGWEVLTITLLMFALLCILLGLLAAASNW